MKLTVETIVSDAMRDLADAHRAYKAFLVADADDPFGLPDVAERRQQILYNRLCTARDRVVALAVQMFPAGATRRPRSAVSERVG